MLVRIDDLQKPTVRVAESDFERLENLSSVARGPGAEFLARELERARVVSDSQIGEEAPFVRLGAFVEYQDLGGGRLRQVQITTPDAADIDEGRLSVLSPVGAALIGLSAGDSSSWTGDDGRPHVVLVHWVGDHAPGGAKRRAV